MDIAKTVTLDIACPESLVLSRDVEMAVLPGADGDIAVMPGRAPVVATLRPGSICIFADGTVRERYFISGGFFEITPDRCTVLTESATPIADIDEAQATADLERLRRQGQDTADEDATTALAVAEARLAAAQRPAYA